LIFIYLNPNLKVLGIEDKPLCLCLNKRWQRIGVKSVRDAFNELVSPYCSALNIVYKQNEDGSFDFSQIEDIQALKWKEWISLPIRSCDFEIRTSKLTIRVPTVLVCSRYSDMPKKKYSLTKNNIWVRDNGICQYTGKKLDKQEANVDHPMPKSRGGQSTWTNMVLCHKDLNSKKGSKTPEEAGLKLIREPKEMRAVFVCDILKFDNHVDWVLFNK
jgi:5-methylcytosine-specific restriction endonuclease McrA